MASGLLGLVMLGLWIWAIVDAAMSPPEGIRLLPKWAWIVGIVLLWVLGAFAWIVLGRPRGATLGFAGRGHPSTARDEAGLLSERDRKDLERREYYRRMDEELDRRLEERRREGGDGPAPAV